GFKRFPSWMWRNTVVREFIESIKELNLGASFYGLDLYSLHSSMGEVIKYLRAKHPELAKAAIERYSCFDHFGKDPQMYGYAAGSDKNLSCRDEVAAQLAEIRKRATELIQTNGLDAEEEHFYAEQNALVAKNAEEYYRRMYEGQ